MVRIEICEGKITIAYGQDHVTGYFLSISDERLWDSADASDEANAIAFKVTNGAGYFDLRTAPMGFGHRVELNTLLEYWKRYGVPDLHIQRAQRGEDLEDPVNVGNSNQQDANKGSKKKKNKKKKKAKAAHEDLPSTSGTDSFLAIRLSYQDRQRVLAACKRRQTPPRGCRMRSATTGRR
ncbi:hypothetical protein QCA50_016367 [Cerrena zonata]|uniref:Uncharacterized protein n=1 Tax=Cerrena zonata TaxID=2478898 RepID=A0AAW0FNJ5_9APHY